MKRVHNSRLTKIIPTILIAITLIFNPVISAFAAPAVVPVAGEAVYGLLVALGLIVANEAGNGYTWVGSDNPYVDSIFEEQVKNITNKDILISDEMISEVEQKVLPNSGYTTDGTKFYFNGKEVTSGDLYLQASALADVTYSMPTNVSGALPALNFGYNSIGRPYASTDTPWAEVGLDYYWVPYYVTDTGQFVCSYSMTILKENPVTTLGYDFYAKVYDQYSNTTNLKDYIYFPVAATGDGRYYGTQYEASSPNFNIIGEPPATNQFLRVAGTGELDFNKLKGVALLRTTGLPNVSIDGDKNKLLDAVVKPAKNDDDDNDPNTPPNPVPPQKWELWKNIEDLLVFLDTGDPSNGGTDFGQYVNNNYNYVQVDVNIPDSQNVNISGSLDIDKKGDINVTVHEDVSLPDAGNGEGFYNPDAADVVGAIGKDNPVTNMLAGLFSVIDPTLLAVFSTGVSLMIVLGLWKMIRG